jgi:hypothetical protein
MTQLMLTSLDAPARPHFDRRMAGTTRTADDAGVVSCPAIVSRPYADSASERRFDRLHQFDVPAVCWRDVACVWLLMIAVAALLAVA